MDGLMISEATVERWIVTALIRRPQLKRGR